MKLKSLKISNWKQFDNIDIEFHDRLTVLTGSNASGKTTLLDLLGRHFGLAVDSKGKNTTTWAKSRRNRRSYIPKVLTRLTFGSHSRFPRSRE